MCCEIHSVLLETRWRDRQTVQKPRVQIICEIKLVGCKFGEIISCGWRNSKPDGALPNIVSLALHCRARHAGPLWASNRQIIFLERTVAPAASCDSKYENYCIPAKPPLLLFGTKFHRNVQRTRTRDLEDLNTFFKILLFLNDKS